MSHCPLIKCRISSSADDSDDGFIQCLKPGGVANCAIEAIVTETIHLNNRDCDDDLFSSDSEAEFAADLHTRNGIKL